MFIYEKLDLRRYERICSGKIAAPVKGLFFIKKRKNIFFLSFCSKNVVSPFLVVLMKVPFSYMNFPDISFFRFYFTLFSVRIYFFSGTFIPVCG